MLSYLHTLPKVHVKIIGLCVFIGLLSFKPSEPYLSQYLICNLKTATEACAEAGTSQADCTSLSFKTVAAENGYTAGGCWWSQTQSSSFNSTSCSAQPCSAYPLKATTQSPVRCADVNYCVEKSGTCEAATCYKNFSENEVNNSIYPWSTYAYLPALLFLCPLAELVSYRLAILVGIAGRVTTRFLLLFGSSLSAMQLMQVTYSIGTAAEDIFYAYIFYSVTTDMFQTTMSMTRTSALVSCLVASILGDLLVTQASVPLTDLQVISCVMVCIGAALGYFVILPSGKTRQFLELGGIPLPAVAGSATSTAFDDSLASPSVQNDEAVSFESRKEVWRQKWLVFLSQIKFFRLTLQQNAHLSNQVLYWIVANATFTEIFGYEVAVFQQLNGGNNKWNGSVLSVMLLLGSVGAMLPVVLKVDSPGLYSVHAVNTIIGLAGAAGSTFLLVFAYVWTAIASLAMLSLFVACWQFISCIILVQVATELKLLHDKTWATHAALRDIEVTTSYIMTSKSDDATNILAQGMPNSSSKNSAGANSSSSPSASASSSTPPEPPSYAIAIVSLVAASVVLQNLTVAIVFSGLQLKLRESLLVPVYLFVIFTFIFVCASVFRCFWFSE